MGDILSENAPEGWPDPHSRSRSREQDVQADLDHPLDRVPSLPLFPAIAKLREAAFTKARNGYNPDEVRSYLRRVADEIDSVTPAKVAHLTTSIPAISGQPAPRSETAGMLTGRAYQAPGFWTFIIAFELLCLVGPLILVVWSMFFGAADGARSAQVAWAVVLAICSLIVASVFALSGTSTTEVGLKRHLGLGLTITVPWKSVIGFDCGTNGRSGLWVICPGTNGFQRFRVPSMFHDLTPAEAQRFAALLNRSLGSSIDSQGSAERDSRVSMGPGLAAICSFLLLGILAYTAFLPENAGILRPDTAAHLRRWLWLAVLAVFDAWLLLIPAIATGNLSFALVVGVVVAALWLAPTVTLSAVWLRTRTSEGRARKAVG